MYDVMLIQAEWIRPAAAVCAVVWLVIAPVLVARWLARRRRGM